MLFGLRTGGKVKTWPECYTAFILQSREQLWHDRRSATGMAATALRRSRKASLLEIAVPIGIEPFFRASMLTIADLKNQLGSNQYDCAIQDDRDF